MASVPKREIGQYRPIALMACIRKIMDILNTRLIHWLDQQSLFPLNIFGFKHHTSAIDCVRILTADIYSAFLQEHYLNAAFLGIKSAFSNVHIPLSTTNHVESWHSTIIHKIYREFTLPLHPTIPHK